MEDNTVTVNWQSAVLLQASTAVQRTGVVPAWKQVPEGGLQLTAGGGSQLSLAIALNLTATQQLRGSIGTGSFGSIGIGSFGSLGFAIVLTTMSVGHVIVGGVTSFT